MTLGPPRGDLTIEKFGRHKKNDLMADLAAPQGKKATNLTASELKLQLLADADGAEWFKKVFLIY